MKQVCIDVGGTFTDCLVLDEAGELRRFKAPTTPSAPVAGVLAGIGKAAESYGHDPRSFLRELDLIVHGTTLGTNVLLTKGGARTGLVTTEGFRDVIEMRRGIKTLNTSMFDQFVEPYQPIVPRDLRLGVRERVLYTGEVHEPLDEAEVETAVRRLVDAGCEAIAVAFLHSYVNPEHERAAKDIVRRIAPDVFVTASHEILPAWREFERFSTTVVSAYIGPAVEGYLRRLDATLREHGFGGTLLIMLSNGLVQTVERAADRGAYLLTSGPAAAPSGALQVGCLHERGSLLSVDMGGTSFDLCVIHDGVVPRTTEAWVGEERVAIKMVDVATIGAGGGSIAWVDSLGLLRIGPQSAGSDPGPAAYGKGEQPTVTDADLVLGYVAPDYFLGGELRLDRDRSRAALAKLGGRLGLNETEAALAVHETVTTVMADLVTEASTKRGHDVRDFTLVAGGGAGGIHGPAIARRLSIPEVIVPRAAALMSAFGMFTMDIGHELTRSRFLRRDAVSASELQTLFSEMTVEVEQAFAEMGIPGERLAHVMTVEMRYEGQFHEVEVALPATIDDGVVAGLVDAFNARYGEIFGYSMPWQPVQFLTFHLKSTARRLPPFEPTALPPAACGPQEAQRGTRICAFAVGSVAVPVYDGALLQPGHRFEGPALIDDPTTTTLVLDGFSCEVDAHCNLVLRRTDAQPVVRRPVEAVAVT